MLIDLNTFASEIDVLSGFDVVVVGAGAAGITLATKLASLGKRVALVEGGGYEYTSESQEVYKANTIGDPYFELDFVRLRHFGGTTNHWVGWCRTFDKVDFERGYLGAEYEWPINKSDIDPYLQEACGILEIPQSFSDSDIYNSNMRKIEFHFSPPVRFREKYFDDLRNNENVSVFLNANLVDIGGGGSITSVTFESFNGKKLSIAGQSYVFAMGGIENSRYLLWFQELYGNKFFDSKLPLGKFWMEHPHFTLGRAVVYRRKVHEKYYSINEMKQKELQILNCGLRVNYLNSQETNALIQDLRCTAPNLGERLIAHQDLVCGAVFHAAWEQAPVAENKITLDSVVDKFGIPKPLLHWRKQQIDRNTIKQSAEEFSHWLLDADAGRVRLDSWILNDEDYPEDDQLAGHHHMGGTRMHRMPEFGVVDTNCKVFGSTNLYIAGSSIFTTSGHNNPTLPIVQFALRLANHLS